MSAASVCPQSAADCLIRSAVDISHPRQQGNPPASSSAASGSVRSDIMNGLGAGTVEGGGNPLLFSSMTTGVVPVPVDSTSAPLSSGRGNYLPTQSQASYHRASSSSLARCPSSGFDVDNEEAIVRANVVVANGHADIRASAVMTNDNDDDADDGNFEDTFGEILGASCRVTTFLDLDFATTVVSALAGKEVVALYFSAHWCPPCRNFTPKLAGAYQTIAAAKPFEIVFISSDKDEAQFVAYHQKMLWLALPFAKHDLKKKLSKQFKSSSIPALILLDTKTGQVLSKDRCSVIMGETAGEHFPWAPKSLDDLLGEVLINGAGDEVNHVTTLAGKHFTLYVSAQQCPPCKHFTPKLAKTYQAMKARRQDFEVVFVPGDCNEAAFTS